MAKRKKEIKSSPTQAQWKMYNYLCSLNGNENFNNKIKEIRRVFSLPENGFDKDLKDEFTFINKLPAYIDEQGEKVDFQKEVYDLATGFDLTIPWLGAITSYILYDDFFFSKILPYIQTIDISEVLTEQEKANSEPMLDEDEDGDEIVVNLIENITEGFPVGIFISPYATGKDIVDYVKKQYKKEIEPAQLKHREKGIKIGKIRGRNQTIQERDLFICKHKKLPKSELVTRVREEYGDILDYTYINKIIKKKCKKGK